MTTCVKQRPKARSLYLKIARALETVPFRWIKPGGLSTAPYITFVWKRLSGRLRRRHRHNGRAWRTGERRAAAPAVP
ncbi:hypothetical protein RHECNPAF_280092 [Rhizobium etli CNPAF512]|nr:hypothetical protein RHECNPAF_280092 [Rhizobium etli CNPAF512]